MAMRVLASSFFQQDTETRQSEDVFSEFQKRKGTMKGKRESTGSKIAAQRVKTTTHSVCAPRRCHGRVAKMSIVQVKSISNKLQQMQPMRKAPILGELFASLRELKRKD